MMKQSMKQNPDVGKCLKHFNGKPMAYPMLFSIAEFTFKSVFRTHDRTPLHQNFGEIGKGHNLKSVHNSHANAVKFNRRHKLRNKHTNESNQNNSCENSHFVSLPSFTVLTL